MTPTTSRATSDNDAPAGCWSRLLPYVFEGTVVHGFGRGGKQLDCPTANLDDAAVARLPEGLINGVYWGTGHVGENDKELGIVLSIGYNPHFGNEKKTLEVHFLAKLDDFYGARVEGTIRGYLRAMTAFSSMEALVEQIRRDKEDAAKLIEERTSRNKI